MAASTAFSTPIASPVNTLVLVPGSYRFADYARAGIPLQVVVLVICLLVIPFLFPW
nr:anion permease [Chloroflexus aggregans]